MRRTILIARSLLIVAILMTLIAVRPPSKAPLMAQQDMWLQWTPSSPWKPNDRTRPLPPVITPGTASTQASAATPPSDAILLFNGKDLSNWESINGGPASGRLGMVILLSSMAQGISEPKIRTATANCTSNGRLRIRPTGRTKTEATAAYSCRGSTKFRYSTRTRMLLMQTVKPLLYMDSIPR